MTPRAWLTIVFDFWIHIFGMNEKPVHTAEILPFPKKIYPQHKESITGRPENTKDAS